MDLRDLARAMFDLCLEKRGLGIAAPQVGQRHRMFVLMNGPAYESAIVCINPQIIKRSVLKMGFREGCLSRPGEFVNIGRPVSVEVAYNVLSGKRTIRSLYGLRARCFQHELDHLDGKTIFASPVRSVEAAST